MIVPKTGSTNYPTDESYNKVLPKIDYKLIWMAYILSLQTMFGHINMYLYENN